MAVRPILDREASVISPRKRTEVETIAESLRRPPKRFTEFALCGIGKVTSVSKVPNSLLLPRSLVIARVTPTMLMRTGFGGPPDVELQGCRHLTLKLRVLFGCRTAPGLPEYRLEGAL